jgi:hypothetical protein
MLSMKKTPYGSILALFGLYLEEEKRYHHQTLGSSSPTYTMIYHKERSRSLQYMPEPRADLHKICHFAILP